MKNTEQDQLAPLLVDLVDDDERPFDQLARPAHAPEPPNASIVHPRDVFAPAMMHNAAALIVAHNHPSGDATPSAEDTEVTQGLKDAGHLLGISLLQHIIITQFGYATL